MYKVFKRSDCILQVSDLIVCPNRINKIVVVVWPILFFPYFRLINKTEEYISSLFLSRDEHLVQSLAHEFRHMWQSYNKGRIFYMV
jgi:hypothetical protein